LRGKGGHIRTIPVPAWVKQSVDSWSLGAGINAGPLLRSINKAGRIWGDGFTPEAIWAIVKANAKSCGSTTIAPHIVTNRVIYIRVRPLATHDRAAGPRRAVQGLRPKA
jgi:hypothetical protein